ncbi:MAG: alginate export family protein, partial [Planctomycetota bacterium]
RSFDGGRATLETGPWQINGFWARPVANDIEDFDDTSNDTQSLWGVYATRKLADLLPHADAGLDLYYLGFLDDASVFVQNVGDPIREIRHTLDTRFFGTSPLGPGTLDWDLEAFYQFGRFGSGDINAWSLASSVGYTFDTAYRPRLGLKANVVSGDDDPDDPELESFNPLFPKGKYFGELTPVGPYNLINLQALATVQPTDRWSITLQGGPFWRESADDGVYDIPGNIVREPGGSDARFIGWQWDAIAEAKLTRELSLLLSYSQFIPGDFIADTGPDEAINFAAVELLLRF